MLKENKTIQIQIKKTKQNKTKQNYKNEGAGVKTIKFKQAKLNFLKSC